VVLYISSDFGERYRVRVWVRERGEVCWSEELVELAGMLSGRDVGCDQCWMCVNRRYI
jgi:hypothetical protein